MGRKRTMTQARHGVDKPAWLIWGKEGRQQTGELVGCSDIKRASSKLIGKAKKETNKQKLKIK